MLLKVHLGSDADYHTLFNDLFYRTLREHSLLSVETVRDGKELELVYSLEFKPSADEAGFIDQVRTLAQGRRGALLTGQEQIDV